MKREYEVGPERTILMLAERPRSEKFHCLKLTVSTGVDYLTIEKFIILALQMLYYGRSFVTGHTLMNGFTLNLADMFNIATELK